MRRRAIYTLAFVLLSFGPVQKAEGEPDCGDRPPALRFKFIRDGAYRIVRLVPTEEYSRAAPSKPIRVEVHRNRRVRILHWSGINASEARYRYRRRRFRRARFVATFNENRSWDENRQVGVNVIHTPIGDVEQPIYERFHHHDVCARRIERSVRG